jgi:hypothetical protein
MKDPDQRLTELAPKALDALAQLVKSDDERVRRETRATIAQHGLELEIEHRVASQEMHKLTPKKTGHQQAPNITDVIDEA